MTADRRDQASVAAAGTSPVLAARAVSKSFGRVRALDRVSLELHPRRVHAIVGENGAGKSTLTAVLGGVLQPDEGTVEVRGRVTRFRSPAEALGVGIGIVYQELSLIADLSVADNVMLDIQPRRRGLIDRRRQRAHVAELLGRLGASGIPVATPVRELSLVKQQLVEIAKVLARDPAVIIFDEPTAMLPADDTANLLVLIRRLAEDGVAIGYISHRLVELEEVADEITVLRDGERIWTRSSSAVEPGEVVAAMVGRAVDEAFPVRETTAAPSPLLEIKGVMLPGSEPEGIDLTCHRGEILGVAGLVGSGRSRIARYLMGLEGDHGGEVRLDGEVYRARSPRAAIRRGVMLVPEDRKALGLVLSLGIDRNIGLPSLPQLSRWGLIDVDRERRLAEETVKDLDVRTGDVTMPALGLSGGNQQKVVLGKWLAKEPKLLILDEPLRGIDVRAKSEVHRILRRLADSGLSIILISSELPEVLGLSDRVVVMRDGRVAAVFEDKPFAPDAIMAVATMEPV